ncbi:MAG: helix-turn-helix domain-containing protein [Lachnospiraceae bacterium]|nr:helix-turn-helix domain-containing protein [Lachnospiraceae bacterium]
MAEYNKAKIIKYSRVFNKMTQEKLAEEICEPETINRYETGILDPSQFNYYLMMQRLGEHVETYKIPGDFISFELVNLRKRIKKLVEEGRYDEVREENVKYKELMDDSVDNIQFVERIDAIIDCNKELISRDECIEKLVNTLRRSYPDFSFDNLNKGRLYSETELLVINSLIIELWQNDDIDLAIDLCEKMESCFDNSLIKNDTREREKLLLNYSNILGLNGRYEDSIEVCKKGIIYINENKRCNYLFNFYFNIGWNLEQIAEKGGKTREEQDKMLQSAMMYYWVAYKLCNILPECKDNLPIIKKTLDALVRRQKKRTE